MKSGLKDGSRQTVSRRLMPPLVPLALSRERETPRFLRDCEIWRRWKARWNQRRIMPRLWEEASQYKTSSSSFPKSGKSFGGCVGVDDTYIKPQMVTTMTGMAMYQKKRSLFVMAQKCSKF